MAPLLSNPSQRLKLVEPAAEPARPPRLEVVGAYHAFGSRVALAGVDLVIRPGEIFGLLGPNGAGKSTLMKAVCGRTLLDRGTIKLDGVEPRADAATRHKIGFVPQDIALYGFMTVQENLAVFARLAGVPRAEVATAVNQALLRTGVGDRADQLCRSLSGGYQRRVNICASLLHQPTLLVLDEPTVGIDIDAREAIHALLLDLRARGTSLLIATHDLDQAQTLADRIGILEAGRFVAEGAPADLLVAAFAGKTELIAVLSKVDEARGAALRAVGFVPSSTPGTWVCLAAIETIDLQAVARKLSATGVLVKELRVRDPDLSTLFVSALKQGAAS
jgi:ABC-2 type transport system ATP-binding protein